MAYPPDPVETRGTSKPHSGLSLAAMKREHSACGCLWPEIERLFEQIQTVEREAVVNEAHVAALQGSYAMLEEQFEVEREALRLACCDLQDVYGQFTDDRATFYEPPDQSDVRIVMDELRKRASFPASRSNG